MARAATICAKPGCPHTASYRGLCRGHAQLEERGQKQTVPTKNIGRSYEERRRRAQAVEAHRARFGDICPGFGRPPHPATDLTAQHATALVLGGAQDQPLMVLCRACNSRHGVLARNRQRDRRFVGVGETL